METTGNARRGGHPGRRPPSPPCGAAPAGKNPLTARGKYDLLMFRNGEWSMVHGRLNGLGFGFGRFGFGFRSVHPVV
jgi:hypothetical protein